jgi:ABC-type glycerol-3-phosphate transport system substrate-binding protein
MSKTKPTRRGLTRRGVLGLAAGLAATLPMGRARAQAEVNPATLRRAGRNLLNFRAWERYPASDVPQLARFLDRNTDLSIQWVSTPFARYRDVMIAEFIARTAVDVVQVPETELAAWADSGWLAPLDGLPGLDTVLGAATPTAVSGTKGLNGKTYALPFLSDAFGFAYDHEVLTKAGFAKTARNLDELRVQMQAVKRAGLDEFPLSLAMRRQPGQFWSLWATVYASGAELFDDAGAPLFDRAGHPLAAILEWYVAAINDWRITSPDDLQRDWGAARTAIRSGTVKFGYVAQYSLAEFNIWPDSKAAGKIKLGLVPGLERNDIGTVGYAHSVGMATSSQNRDAAWRALRAYAGPDETGAFAMPRARLLSEGGRSPFPNLISDPEVGAFVNRMNLGDTDDFNRLSTIGRQRKGIKTTWYPEWEQTMMGTFQEALLKRVTVGAAITSVANEARRLAKG